MFGVMKGCQMAGVELIGGETAEHGRFASDIDLAGFCTGVVEDYNMITGVGIKEGDKIIGLESSGLHSNGFSLINDMITKQKLFLNRTPELLTPTTIYAPLIMYLLRKKRPIHGMAHITGGGIPENLPRCLPEGLTAHIDYNSWPLPEIFNKIMLAGEIPEEEMKKVFNLGIGFCIIVPPDVTIDNMECWTIGHVVIQ